MNDIVPLSSSTWVPPESKGMQKLVNYGLIALVLTGVAVGINLLAPTYVSAISLVRQVFTSTISMILTGVGLVAVSYGAYETLSPNGKINKMLRLPYRSAINWLTRTFIEIDPLSPINERIRTVRADFDLFDHQHEQLVGVIANVQEKEESFRRKSAEAQRTGKAAASKGMDAALDVASHTFGSYRDAAEEMAKLRRRLEPVRDTFDKIAGACRVTIQKLETERQILENQWEVQKQVASATAAASRVLGRSRTEVWNQALQAENVITTKYAQELGHLDHLKRYAQPFIESIDLERGSYREDLLEEVQASGTRLISSTAATPLPVQTIDMAPVVGQPDAFARVMRSR